MADSEPKLRGNLTAAQRTVILRQMRERDEEIGGRMQAKKHPSQIVGNIGLYYACYKLSALGWNVMSTSRNARGIDIICFSMDGARMVTVQVKSLSKKTTVPLGTSLDKLMGDFWIIVNSVVTKPQTYILLPHEVRAMAARAEREGKVTYWLEPKKYAIAEFREKWDRIGTA